MRTKVVSENVKTLAQQLAMEYGLTIDMGLIRLHMTQVDQRTRVTQRWLGALQKEMGPVCAASVEQQESAHGQIIHE